MGDIKTPSADDAHDSQEPFNIARLEDGRFVAPHFSRLVARCAQMVGAQSRLAKVLASAQEASDHLKAKGFASIIIDRVMWVPTEPFPLSLAVRAEHLFKAPPFGVGLVDNQFGQLYSPTRESLRNSWRAAGSIGSSFMSPWDEKAYPGVKGVGDQPLAARISLGGWRDSFLKDLEAFGLRRDESIRFVAGHELGHVVFMASGHQALMPVLLKRLGVAEKKMKGHPCGLVARMAEELFADALGALAAKPDGPEIAMKAINHARSKTSLWSQPSPIYLQDGGLRDNVAQHLKSAKWSGRDGAVDLAVECLAVALTARTSLGLFEARRRLAQAFAKERGREWIDAAPAPSKRGPVF